MKQLLLLIFTSWIFAESFNNYEPFRKNQFGFSLSAATYDFNLSKKDISFFIGLVLFEKYDLRKARKFKLSHGGFLDFGLGSNLNMKNNKIKLRWFDLHVAYFFRISWPKLSLDFLFGVGTGIIFTFYKNKKTNIGVAVTILSTMNITMILFLYDKYNIVCASEIFLPTLKLIFYFE